jgi:DNA processing protein
MTFLDVDYPEHLKHVPDPPLVLYFRGERRLIEAPGVAVVGARRCSRVGADIAANLAAGIAAQGLPIVSGLARGIDAAAHQGLLDSAAVGAARGVAVLGSGLSRIYPRSNVALADQLVAGGGLLVSEYPPQLPPAKHQFPERNRLISGLSLGVVVVEAGERSGSLITARLALEQGREVLAVPGSLAGGRSRGCHRLLKQGAALVEDVADVCHALGLEQARRAPEPAALAAELAPVLSSVGPAVCSLDEIAIAAGVASQVAAEHLLRLELEGFVAQVPGGYIRRPSSQWTR